MRKFIYQGPGHNLMLAGMPLYRGRATELEGRAADMADAHPDVQVAADAGQEAGTPPWGTTVKSALAYAGDDAERATEVLAAETAGPDAPRHSLTSKLEAIIDAAGEAAE